MKKPFQLMLLFLILGIVLSSCASGNRVGGTNKNCGCGNNKGMVGY